MMDESLVPAGTWMSMSWLFTSSIVGFCVTLFAIPRFRETFIKANIVGIDVSKASKPKIPEANGIICGCVFLIVTILMLPLTFSPHLTSNREPLVSFPFVQLVQLLAALFSISQMLCLGFVDDVLDLQWRHKLLLPSVASLPLLIVYYLTSHRTVVVVPIFMRTIIGLDIVDLSWFYYIYMGLLAVFATNAINILAGINGLEVGQSLVIGSSLIIFNLIEMSSSPLAAYSHNFSLYFLVPFVAISAALLWYNWYPATVFAGDTFCYFAGMTLAVVAILGHFSKTLLLFFMPQVANFLYSTPQLFRILPCPRHRMPRFVAENAEVTHSNFVFKESTLGAVGRLTLRLLSSLRLVKIKAGFTTDDVGVMECNNLTLLNFVLLKRGTSMKEQHLTLVLLGIQMLCSLIAFFVRFPLASWLFGLEKVY